MHAALIAGGRSNLTFRLWTPTPRGCSGALHRAGRTPSAHDVAREFWVTRALAGTASPSPRRSCCARTDLIGAPFAVAEFVEGTTVRPVPTSMSSTTHSHRLCRAPAEVAGGAALCRPRRGRARALRAPRRLRRPPAGPLVGPVEPDGGEARPRRTLAATWAPCARAAGRGRARRLPHRQHAAARRRVRVAALVDWELSTSATRWRTWR